MSKLRRFGFSKIVCSVLLASGGVLIGLSVIYDLVLAFFGGCVLVFWGSIMTFISSEGLTKRSVCEATSLTYMASLSKMVQHVNPQSMIYTPPGYLNQARNITNQLLTPILNVEFTIGTPEVVNLAPENELFNLLERTNGRSFSGMSFSEFETALPKLLVESLELAEEVQVEASGGSVRVTLKKPADRQVYLKTLNQAALIGMYGFPLSSAIAYALAYSSGVPITIGRHLISQDGELVIFEFHLLGNRRLQA